MCSPTESAPNSDAAERLACARRPFRRGRPRGRAARRDRRGQALLEFALIALVMYLLLAATIEFGRLLYGAQAAQSAVDLAAREISRIPLSPTTDFAAELQNPGSALQSVYSEDYLAIVLPAGASVLPYLDGLNLPPVNKALVPLMVVDTVGGQQILRYPGALVSSSTAPSGLTVMVPIVTSAPGVGPETIEWRRVLEEIVDSSGNSAFSVAWSDPSGGNMPGGLVALRLNYPFQAATLAGYQPPALNESGETLPNAANPMLADDGGVTATNAVPSGGSLVAPDSPPPDERGSAAYAGPYGGAYGLGEMGLVVPGQGPQTVRPFRRVISVQAVCRREVFGS